MKYFCVSERERPKKNETQIENDENRITWLHNPQEKMRR